MRHQQPGRVPVPPGYAAAPPVPPPYASAFIDGRRMRERSQARRGSYGPRPHRHNPLPIIVLILAIVLVTGGGEAVVGAMALGVIGFAGLFLTAPLLLLGGVTFAAVRRQRRHALRRGGAAGTAPLPARPAAPPRPDLVWGHARRRFDALRSAYAGYECDAMAVLRLPALADVAVPSTARFVDAFAEAQALDTDAFPGGPHAASFVTAVDRAERAWKAAREAAERIRLSTLSPAERATVERVIKLLTTARDSDSDAERIAAYGRARSELMKLDRAGVVHMPLPAQAALDTAARGALPAA